MSSSTCKNPIEHTDNHVNPIKVKALDCAIASRKNKVIVLRPSLPTPERQYNPIEQLEKTHAIQNLLNTSIVHKDVVFQELRVPIDIPTLNAHLSVSQQAIFNQ